MHMHCYNNSVNACHHLREVAECAALKRKKRLTPGRVWSQYAAQYELCCQLLQSLWHA